MRVKWEPNGDVPAPGVKVWDVTQGPGEARPRDPERVGGCRFASHQEQFADIVACISISKAQMFSWAIIFLVTAFLCGKGW